MTDEYPLIKMEEFPRIPPRHIRSAGHGGIAPHEFSLMDDVLVPLSVVVLIVMFSVASVFR